MPDRHADAADVASFASLLESRYDELRRFALRRGGSPSLADDVLQDAWLRLSREPHTAVGNRLAYVYRVVANLVIDRQRQRAAHERHVDGETPAENIQDGAPTPDQVVAGQQEYALLQAAIQALPPKCREVFLLYRGENLTMREIALRLAISPKTVENHIAQAMLACRRRLREAGHGR
jgi:RNA polymerase sigma factor (sigma-70 family)